MDDLPAAPVRLLPDDVLACILRRLNPRGLAASRCVCKAWRGVVDTQTLLRADLLPLSVHGIFFLEEVTLGRLGFFARPQMEHKIADRFVGVPSEDRLDILDHRGGLLLLRNWVVNPATRQCVPLPPPPPLCAWMENFYDSRHLVFDPTVSPHYDVFSIPKVSVRLGDRTKFTKDTEWPPSPYTLAVFSSRTGRWEERSFVREGEATRTTIADMKPSWGKHRYSVQWRDALYVHSEDDSIIRITLSSHKYQVIPSPTGCEVTEYQSLYLGKSMNGVYCALMYNDEERLRIWLLHELSGQTKWVLKNDVSIQPLVGIRPQDFGGQNYGLWTLQNVGGFAYEEPMPEQNFEWDLDSGITLEGAAKAENNTFHDDIGILGFHPYKEILFLWTNNKRVVAYNLNSSKAQDLGKLLVPSVEMSFVYTPLLDGGIMRKQLT